jgi:hypothetical protein
MRLPRQAAEKTALLQYCEVFPPAGAMVPQVLLGRRIIELMTERYPNLREVGSV